MARKPRGASAEKEQELELLKAMRFISIAQREEGTPYQTHCRFTGSEVVAFDGILAAGYPCQQIMNACPHTFNTIAALSRLRGQWSLTMLDADKMVLNDGKFRAIIPCLRPVDVESVGQQPLMYPLNEEFKHAADKAGVFITEAGQRVIDSSLLSRDGSLIGCNGLILIEAWHGNPFPPGLIIPWTAFKALKKIDLKLIGFGFDANAVTFHFEGGAWLKTQLFQSDYPDVGRLVDQCNAARAVPKAEELERAINAVIPHSATNRVWIENHVVRSHESVEVGATYNCDGLPFAKSINGDMFLKVAAFVTHIDFVTGEHVYFFGQNLRGLFTVYGR
jgi:hypothetical protein